MSSDCAPSGPVKGPTSAGTRSSLEVLSSLRKLKVCGDFDAELKQFVDDRA
ncbi:hypothetical protein ABZT43_48195 [Streptomyces sp. NPDC005349]|uniref:hypothetical protein n=1 Tax=Streptomyces sp. NPDC005349 TaxID=3157037 RepID=UPI0033A5D4EA